MQEDELPTNDILGNSGLRVYEIVNAHPKEFSHLMGSLLVYPPTLKKMTHPLPTDPEM
jgi:hypothetical protein